MAKLGRNAVEILEKRYFLRDPGNGTLCESVEGLFRRVSKAVASSEAATSRRRWQERFFDLLVSGRFLPNSPTLMNAGKEKGQLSACYVLPIDDDLGSIFSTLRSAALIHQSGGGTGFSFSELRPKGARVRTSAGVASGPVSFIRIFDAATETIKQGGTRRGANMAVLRVDHPDIREFISLKKDQESGLNFNISVGVTDAFIRAVKEDREMILRDPHTNKEHSRVSATRLFDEIAEGAWSCGDPGLIFLDRVNAFNPTPERGDMVSTNPCGEQPLLDYESCNLGSLNLLQYVENGGFDWDQFVKDIDVATRFLDNVIDINYFPVPECRAVTKLNRKIGLGVMGFADTLLVLGLPYQSDRARSLGEKIISVMDRTAKQTSAELAREKGKSGSWNHSMWQKLGYFPMRNVTVSTVAPTGTISLIAGVSSGIEPHFAAVFERRALEGRIFRDVSEGVLRILERAGVVDVETLDFEEAEKILVREAGDAWSPARKIASRDHLKMQAVFQRHVDSAVSKTINFPNAATVEDVRDAFLFAHSLGLKGVTVFRDGCRSIQVLSDRASTKRETCEPDKVCVSCE